MSRMIAVGLISAILGVCAGAGLIQKFRTPPRTPMLATVDLVGIVERLRAGALKQAGDPEEGERTVTKRMDRLAHLLAEIGKERVILNKAAVVSGRLPDVTEEIEARLREP